jgi:hypothetical protein
MAMLRIENQSDACSTRLVLSGRIQSDRIACIRSALKDACGDKTLDLNEVTLVDVEVVRFLIHCEGEGIRLVQCPPYVREWMVRERTEAAEPELVETV